MTTSCSSTCAVSDSLMPCLISWRPGVRPGGVAFDDEERGAVGRLRENRVEVRDRPVRDELLHAVQAVVGDAAVAVGDARGFGLEVLDVRPGLGLRHAVGDNQSLLRDPVQPHRLLLVRAADADGIRAERDREHRGGEAEIDLRELHRQPVDVVRAAAHPAVLLGQEDEMEAHVGPEHGAHHVGRARVGPVPFQALLERRFALGELLQRLHDEVDVVRIQPLELHVGPR